MQQVKIRILVSVSGLNPIDKGSFSYGKGAEIWISPLLASSFINAGQAIILEGSLEPSKPIAKVIKKKVVAKKAKKK